MSLNEIREKTVEELKARIIEIRQSQLKLRLLKASGQLEKTHQFKELRREIAQIKTVLTQKGVKV